MSPIEREYREALDGLRFAGGAKERMIKTLKEQKEAKPMKSRKYRATRAGLIAAALCAALLGTAGAAQFLGIHINWQDDSWEGGKSYAVEGGVACFAADSFSQQVHDLAAPNRLTGKNFSSWAELEEFLGMDLPDSAVLESARPGPNATVEGRKL